MGGELVLTAVALRDGKVDVLEACAAESWCECGPSAGRPGTKLIA
jgi:hypothetical protein